MVRTWIEAVLFSSCFALSACILTEPVNVAPEIALQSPEGPFHRGQAATFSASVTDDGDSSLRWGHTLGACPAELDTSGSTEEGTASQFDLVPGASELGSLCVWLEARDELGATASAQTEITVVDRRAEASIVQAAPKSGQPVRLGSTVKTVWTVSDPDPGDEATYSAVLRAPSGALAPLAACAGEKGDSTFKCFVMTETGAWTLSATLEGETTPLGTVIVLGDEDQPPCLTAMPASAVFPHDADKPLLLQVSADDDLDSFPSALGMNSQAKFLWSVSERIGAPFQRLVDNEDRSFRVDGQRFRPADELRVRVDVLDRKRDRQTACPDTNDTCGTPACSQRMTWKVEFR